MSQLHEISVRAKYDGAFTQEWATLKRLLAPERGHRKNGGGSELEKLRTWAEREGLCLDFEVEFDMDFDVEMDLDMLETFEHDIAPG